MAFNKKNNAGQSTKPVHLVGLHSSNPLGFFLLLCVFFFAELPITDAESNPETNLVLITNPSVINDVYRTHTVRAIFGLRLTTWPDGQAITVFVRNSDSQAHLDFCRDILRMLPYRLSRNWDRLLFSGTGMIPETVTSDEEMLTRVAETPGAIGYISAEKINDSVSVLEVK